MADLFFDDFVASNGTTLASRGFQVATSGGSPTATIQDNQAEFLSVANGDWMNVSRNLTVTDGGLEIPVRVGSGSGNKFFALAIRATVDVDGYFTAGYALGFDIGSRTATLYRMDTWATITSSANFTPADQSTLFTIRFEAEGTTIRAKAWEGTGADPSPGTWPINGTDSLFASGRTGVALEGFASGSRAWFADSWRTYDFTSANPVELEGSAENASDSQATLSVSSPTPVPLAGYSPSASGAVGSLSVDFVGVPVPLEGYAGSASGALGDLTVTSVGTPVPLGGAGESASGALGDLTVTFVGTSVPLEGAASSASGALGTLDVEVPSGGDVFLGASAGSASGAAGDLLVRQPNVLLGGSGGAASGTRSDMVVRQRPEGYVRATGGRVVDLPLMGDHGWRWHIFEDLGADELVVTAPGPATILVLGGGGASGFGPAIGGSVRPPGGGASGEFVEEELFELSVGTHEVVVGDGGKAVNGNQNPTQSGEASSFGNLEAGGGGGGGRGGSNVEAGYAPGGGGAGTTSGQVPGAGAAGNVPYVYPGSSGAAANTTNARGGGGGGAAEPGGQRRRSGNPLTLSETGGGDGRYREYLEDLELGEPYGWVGAGGEAGRAPAWATDRRAYGGGTPGRYDLGGLLDHPYPNTGAGGSGNAYNGLGGHGASGLVLVGYELAPPTDEYRSPEWSATFGFTAELDHDQWQESDVEPVWSGVFDFSAIAQVTGVEPIFEGRFLFGSDVHLDVPIEPEWHPRFGFFAQASYGVTLADARFTLPAIFTFRVNMEKFGGEITPLSRRAWDLTVRDKYAGRHRGRVWRYPGR